MDKKTSVIDRVKRLLHPTNPLTPKVITQKIQADRSAVTSALHVLIHKGGAVKSGHGQYLKGTGSRIGNALTGAKKQGLPKGAARTKKLYLTVLSNENGGLHREKSTVGSIGEFVDYMLRRSNDDLESINIEVR